MDKLRLFTNSIEVAEHADGEDLSIKICLCDFSANANSVRINRGTIENWMSTIIDAPIVAAVKVNPITGKRDFTGHAAKIAIGADGKKELVFDSSAYGTITECAIEEINGVEYIVISAKIWSRFKAVVDLILSRVESDGLNTSWEIEVSESHIDAGVKVIDAGRFIGHALLGAGIEPAYPCSRLLEVASEDEVVVDEEFAQAFASDFNSQEKDGEQMKKKNEDFEVVVEAAEDKKDVTNQEIVDEPETDKVEEDDAAKCGEEQEKVKKSEQESASLTEWDLREKLGRACAAKFNQDWCWVAFMFPAESKCWVRYAAAQTELDYAEFDYVVSNDEVTVGDPTYITLVASPRAMSAKLIANSVALTKANELMQSLTAQVEALGEYKESYERALSEKAAAEKASKQKELSEYLLKSGRITSEEIETDEEIKSIISELDENRAKLLIADRFMASLNVETPHETAVSSSSQAPLRAIITDEEPVNPVAAVMGYLNSSKKKK